MRLELVSIETSTYPLDGALYQPESGAGKGAILIMHGNCGNFYTGVPRHFAPLLVRLGYAVLAYNRRGHDIMPVAIDVRPHLDAFAHDPFHRKAAAVDQGINVFDVESACSGALDSLRCFVHDDVTDMEMTSRFVRGKRDAPDLYRKPFAGHWFPGNAGDASELNTAILLPHLGNFATPAGVACKRRAEWTYIPELATLESRPNLWTARVTAM